jgi:hypothetical protein
MPQWMHDCINYYMEEEKRPPNTSDFLMWREAEASCAMEREQ